MTHTHKGTTLKVIKNTCHIFNQTKKFAIKNTMKRFYVQPSEASEALHTLNFEDINICRAHMLEISQHGCSSMCFARSCVCFMCVVCVLYVCCMCVRACVCLNKI